MTTPMTAATTDGPRATTAGARAMAPLLVSVAPLGLVVGLKAAAADLPAAAGWATSFTIYGASAQLAAIDLLDRGVAPALVVLTVVVVNARLALYSAALGRSWSTASGPWQALAAYLLVDPSYATGIDGYARPLTTRERHTFYLAAAATLWVGWQVLTLAGMTLGTHVPTGLELGFAAPLCLLAIAARQVDDRSSAVTAVVAAVVAVLGHGLPMATGLPLAIVAGVLAGAARERGTRP
ncbi:MAG TPA: AzlC family ABC transporter permease [Acidimicrobiales bacterium]